jgi:hypothetical protein
MSNGRGIRRPGSRLRSAAGAAVAMLGVLIAVGVGALMITSPCAETCSGCGYRPQRRTSRVLRPGYVRGERWAPVYRRDGQQPKSAWRATGAQMPINATRGMIALPVTAVAAAIRRQRLLLAAWRFGGSLAARGAGRDR